MNLLTKEEGHIVSRTILEIKRLPCFRTGWHATLVALARIRVGLDRIQDRSEQGTIAVNGVRSVRLHRFPYVVHFRIEGTTVVVFAIMFGGRTSSAWRDRM